MPSCLFILLRFFLRLDGVVFRIHDTRLYHAFESPELIREYTAREADYNMIRNVTIQIYSFCTSLHKIHNTTLVTILFTLPFSLLISFLFF